MKKFLALATLATLATPAVASNSSLESRIETLFRSSNASVSEIDGSLYSIGRFKSDRGRSCTVSLTQDPQSGPTVELRLIDPTALAPDLEFPLNGDPSFQGNLAVRGTASTLSLSLNEASAPTADGSLKQTRSLTIKHDAASHITEVSVKDVIPEVIHEEATCVFPRTLAR